MLQTLYQNNIITHENINCKSVQKLFGFSVYSMGLSINDIYKEVLGITIKSKDGFGIDNFEDAKTVFLSYTKKTIL